MTVTRTAIVVMGVAGSGKSTVARQLAARLAWTYAEADDFHPAVNVAKMSAGVPLTDEDRSPWLTRIRDWITEQPRDVVVTCSALRRTYRDHLRQAEARVRFLHLHGSSELLSARISARTGHFMPPTLLASQLATLEPLQPDEDGVTVDINADAETIVGAAITALHLDPRRNTTAIHPDQ
jgi:gluconokinase